MLFVGHFYRAMFFSLNRDLGSFPSNSSQPAGTLMIMNLYGELCYYENLLWAFRKAAKGKSGKWYVREFRKDLKNNLLQIQKELVCMSYKPRPLKTFVISDPKTRVISASDFRDRVVHHALDRKSVV